MKLKNKIKKYLVLGNLLFQGYYIEVSNHKDKPKDNTLSIILFVLILLIVTGCLVLYSYLKRKQRTKSKSIDFTKKEEPAPLYPPNQPYSSSQINDTSIQQPSAPQPIPPEVMDSNETGYSSGMGQQNGYSSGAGEQGYYSGMAVPPS